MARVCFACLRHKLLLLDESRLSVLLYIILKKSIINAQEKPMPKAADDFAKKTGTQKTFAQETSALAAVLDALAGLDAASQAFVLQTAGQRLGLGDTPKSVARKPPARKPADKTHWYSDTQPFGPRNLDC